LSQNQTSPTARHNWVSSSGFLLAAAGAATGLGGLWRFPFIAGENGGGAFVLLYIFFVIVIGLPIMMAEMAIGRLGKRSAYGSVKYLITKEKKSPTWYSVGFLSVLIPFFGLSYYAVVAGWTLDYFYLAASGSLGSTTAENASLTFNAGTTAPVRQISLHAIFIALTALVVSRGVNSGIERTSKIMMPALFLILTCLTVYNFINGAGFEAASFLFKPDFSKINSTVALLAMGQALFSLAVGVGVLITYSAYSSDKENLPQAVGVIALANTFVALMAGLAIFSVVFEYGLDIDSGPNLLFVTLPVAFAQMPGGDFIATLFFLLVIFAAFTTTIGMLEPVVAWLEERLKYSRGKLTILAAVGAWIAGLLPVLSFNLLSNWHPLSLISIMKGKTVFDIYDFFITTMLLPLNALLIALFTGWVIGTRKIGDALNLGTGMVYKVWALLLRYILPLAILILWINSWTTA